MPQPDTSERSYSFTEIRVRMFRTTSKIVWQADCGDDRARGDTASQAVERLVDYIIEKRECETRKRDAAPSRQPICGRK